MLRGLMALYFTDIEHDTPGVADEERDYDLIYKAGQVAATAVLNENVENLAEAVRMSYQAQTGEGMAPLMESEKCLACKYCGGGWGGYALYLFSSHKDRDGFVNEYPQARAIEPYIKTS